MNKRWYLVRYPDGVQMVEHYSETEAEVKSRAVNKPLVPVIVMTEQEYNDRMNLPACMVGNWEDYLE